MPVLQCVRQMTDEEKARESLALFHRAIDGLKKGNNSFAFDQLYQAIELNPDEPAFRMQIAITAVRMARQWEHLYQLAFQNAMHVCRVFPDKPEYWVGLGEICITSHKFHEAVAAFERALSFTPDNAGVWSLLGFANTRVGNKDGALHCYQKAVALDPELGNAHFFLSMFYYSHEYFDPAKVAYHAERGFTAKRPAAGSIIESYWNAAHGNLLIGEYGKGWSFYEARLQRHQGNVGYGLAKERFKKTMWKGERNCRILITGEMGFGDAFIMARFLPILQQKFDFKLVLECQPPTIDLMRASFPEVECVLTRDITEDLFDHHIPSLSLPHILRIKSTAVPNEVPYLKASEEKLQQWGQSGMLRWDKKNIGICWSGGSRSYNAQNHQTDKRRSLTYEQIKPLLAIPGINWVSLQAENAPDDFKMHPDAKTFEDTAAIIYHLDAVVSVDTAVINLAGAMGKQGWVFSRVDHCWRWSPHVKTPWYPTIKVLQQTQNGDWSGCLAQIDSELKQFSAKMAA